MKDFFLGVLFLFVVISLSVATVTIGKFTFFKKGTILQVKFSEVKGLKDGDPVFCDGVDVGQVERVELDPSGVIVRLLLERQFNIYEDYEISIQESSLVGGRYVAIKRGTSSKNRVDFSELTQLNGKQAEPFLTTASNLIEENRADIKETISNIKTISKSVRDSLDNNKGTISKLLQDDSIYNNASDALQNLKEITEGIKSGKGTVGKFLNEDAVYQQVNKILADVQEFINGIRTGRGTVSRLVNDEKMAQDLADTLANLNNASGNLKDLLQEAKDKNVIGKLSSTLEGADSTIGKIGRAKLYLKLGLMEFAETDLTISRLGIDYWPGEDKFFYVGASQLSFDKESEILFEDKIQENDDQSFLKPEVQIGYVIPWFLNKGLVFRAGLIEGKFGSAVDFNLEKVIGTGHPIRLTFEVRDSYDDLDDEDIDELIDGVMMRSYIKFPIMTSRDKWWQKIFSSVNFFAGVSRLSNDSEFMFGISLEYQEDDIKSLVGLSSLR
ncbi:MAG: MCE family protein [Planctomycetes bacterium]|nr:MCE family protein [Planctomycetota bacterium]